MAYLHLAHTLADAFNALADEVQTLTDRKTVLEHKLRFAHEQVRNFSCFLVAGPLSLPLPRYLSTSYPGRASFWHSAAAIPELAGYKCQHDEYLSSRSRATD
jgi:hypothetical protein